MISFKDYLEEMTRVRWAAVDKDNKARFISDDKYAVMRVAEKHGHEVRQIFAPKDPKAGTIPLKQVSHNNK